VTINPEGRRARKIELMVMGNSGLVVRVRNWGPRKFTNAGAR